MPWPGSPKSQQTPTINPPSMRYPHTLNEKSSMKDVADAVNTAFDGLTVHEQAFANLPGQIASQASTAATEAVATASETVVQVTGGVTAFNALQGNVIYFPSLGMVNDQLGEPLYLTQQSDNGAKIIVGDSTPVTVSLNQAMTAPWFAIIDNDSSAVAVLSADSGATVYGQTSIPANGFGIVFYDGVNFWAGATGSGGSSGGYSLGGPVNSANLVFGPGAGTGPSLSGIAGLDGNHHVAFQTGTSPAANAIVYTLTFTTPRPNPTYPIVSSVFGSVYSSANQIPYGVGASTTVYYVYSNQTALAPSTVYDLNVSCP